MSLDSDIAEANRQMTELRIMAVYGDPIAALVVNRMDAALEKTKRAWEIMWMEGVGYDPLGLASLVGDS